MSKSKIKSFEKNLGFVNTFYVYDINQRFNGRCDTISWKKILNKFDTLESSAHAIVSVRSNKPIAMLVHVSFIIQMTCVVLAVQFDIQRAVTLFFFLNQKIILTRRVKQGKSVLIEFHWITAQYLLEPLNS